MQALNPLLPAPLGPAPSSTPTTRQGWEDTTEYRAGVASPSTATSSSSAVSNILSLLVQELDDMQRSVKRIRKDVGDVLNKQSSLDDMQSGTILPYLRAMLTILYLRIWQNYRGRWSQR